MSETRLVLARILLDYCQKKYMHQLLCLPDNHPMKKLLLMSFTNRDRYMTQKNKEERDNLA